MYQQMQIWMQSIIENMKLTEYEIGTVIQLNPTKIDFGDNKIVEDVGTNIFYTEAVTEKKLVIGHKHTIDVLEHSHSYSGGTTGQSLSETYPTSDELKTYIITEGIKVGDKLLVLRVGKGQKFIILSKQRDIEDIIIIS